MSRTELPGVERQEIADISFHQGPDRVAFHWNMVGAIVRDKTSVRQPSGERATLLDRLHPVAATMQHEARARDVAKQRRDVDVVDGRAKPRDILRRDNSTHILCNQATLFFAGLGMRT